MTGARYPLGLAGLVLALDCLLSPCLAADAYRKLTEGEIKARLPGMEITDEVHWTERYMPDGTYQAVQMGKARTGTWHARYGQLCLEDGKTGPECKEVWTAGRKVQFRFPGADIPIEAVYESNRTDIAGVQEVTTTQWRSA